MAMVVKNNMSAVRTLNTLNTNSTALSKSLAKVSSGMKINSAQDDASGYAISERMRVQIRSLDQANQNTQNASSLMKTAEGAVSSTVEILKTLKEKAINAATDTNTDADRATIQKELDQFIDQIDDNALTTFNGKYLVDGSKSQSGTATFTAMTNQSLGTEVTGGTALTELTNRNGDSLEIRDTDNVTASFVKNGETFTTIFEVGTNKLEDIFGKLNEAAGGSAAASSAASSTPTAPNFSSLKSAITSAISSVQSTGNLAGTQQLNIINGAKNGVTSYVNSLSTTADANGHYATLSETDANTTVQSTAGYDATYSPEVVGWLFNSTAATNADTAYPNHLAVSGANTVATAIKAYNDAVNAYNSAIDSGGGGGSGSGGGAAAAAAVDAFGPANIEGASGLVYSGSDVGLAASSDMTSTANGEVGITVTAASSGIGGQISGLTISITDSEGNVKKSANAALDDFKTTVYAKNASDNNEMTFQVGAKANQSITVGLDDMRAQALGLKGNSSGTKVSVATQDKANAAVSVFDNAIQKALDQQATIGAIEARLEYTSQNLTTSSENVQAAESTIRDADMAKEMTNYTKNNVLLQAAQSMLAQANQNSSAVLSLLQ